MIACTIFKDAKALQAHTVTLPWPELRSKFLNPDTFKRKEDAPLLKLATFDGTKTARGSLRHNAAMMEIYGVEGDYDAEIITIAQALARLKAANIEAAIYASPSNEAFNIETGGFRGPRWRVIAPLSKSHTPQERKRLVGILNTALGGILTGESFTQSQAFYFGRVDGALWEAGTNAGRYLDEIDDVVPTYPRGHSVGKKHELKDPRDKQDLIGAFCRAFNIYEAIAEFIPDTFEHIDDNHFTWLGHQVRGVFATDDEQHLGASHDTWPFGTNNVANTFDIVRQFKFDPLMEEDILCPAFERPSYRDMCEWAGSLPEVKLEMQGSTDTANAEYFDEVEATEGRDAPANSSKFQAIPAHLFALRPSPTWIVEDVIPQSPLIMVFGASGSGKSFWLLDLCIAIATGSNWRDKYTERGRVVYIVAEGQGGFVKRLNAYALHHNVDLSTIDLDIIAAAPDFTKHEDPTFVIEAIRANNRPDPTFIVIDTFAQVSPGVDENSKEVEPVLRQSARINKALGCSVGIVHHSAKDASKGARGWSGIKAAMDAEIEILRDGDNRCAVISKMKDGEDGLMFPFKLDAIDIAVDNRGKPVTSAVVTHLEAHEVVKKVKELGKVEQKVRDVLVDIGQAQTTGIEVDAVIAEVVAKMVPPVNGKRDNRKQHAKQALESLLDKPEYGFSLVDDCIEISKKEVKKAEPDDL